MKKLLCILLALAMIATLAACGGKKVKLTTDNAEEYLKVEVSFENMDTVYSNYDGSNAKYKGGKWKWGTVDAKITVSCEDGRKVEFKDSVIRVEVNYGSLFGSEIFNMILDENGNWSNTVALTSKKTGIQSNYNSTDYAVPKASYSIIEASGEMKVKK